MRKMDQDHQNVPYVVKKNSIQLDHCHETNTFRGWLCNSCNTGLGKLKDNIAMLEKGIKYLKGELKHEEDIN